MDYDFKQTIASRCLLAGLLAGLSASVLDMIVFFCFATSEIGAEYSLIINPFTIFLGGIIPTIVAGLFYDLFSQMKGGNVFYFAIFFVLTFLFIKMSLQIPGGDDHNVARLFHRLLIAMIVIEGCCTTFLVPFIYRNKLIQRIFF